MIDILVGLSDCFTRAGNLFWYTNFCVLYSSLSILGVPVLSPTPEPNPPCRKIGWRYSKKEFNKFYSKLYLAGLIGDTTYEMFSSHFFGGGAPLKMIPWHGRKIELITLFYILKFESITMAQSNYIRVVNLHFCEPNGDSIKYGTLKSSRMRDVSVAFEEFVTEIINEIKSEKNTNDVLKVVNSNNS
jgi:hypothetical protein